MVIRAARLGSDIVNDLQQQSAFEAATADLYQIAVIADEIIQFTGQNPLDIWRRLALELDHPCSNVIEETKRFGVTPHVFDDAMARFYHESDGFIYESIVESRNRYRIGKWRSMVDFINANKLRPAAETTILMYGDSVGSDSICLKRLGYDVIYHDFDSYCARFAQSRFDRRKLIIPRFSEIARRTFDVVICLEVAEHVPNPPEFIREISGYVEPNGMCLLSESFGLFEPKFPTHLRTNVKFDGKTAELFAANGLTEIWRDVHRKPMVFAASRERLRHDLTPRPPLLRRMREGVRLFVRTLR